MRMSMSTRAPRFESASGAANEKMSKRAGVGPNGRKRPVTASGTALWKALVIVVLPMGSGAGVEGPPMRAPTRTPSRTRSTLGADADGGIALRMLDPDHPARPLRRPPRSDCTRRPTWSAADADGRDRPRVLDPEPPALPPVDLDLVDRSLPWLAHGERGGRSADELEGLPRGLVLAVLVPQSEYRRSRAANRAANPDGVSKSSMRAGRSRLSSDVWPT